MKFNPDDLRNLNRDNDPKYFYGAHTHFSSTAQSSFNTIPRPKSLPMYINTYTTQTRPSFDIELDENIHKEVLFNNKYKDRKYNYDDKYKR